MAANGAAISADVDARGISVDRVGYSGPYLHTPDGQPPKDIFTGSTDWNYNSSTGELHSSSTLAALDGTSYATW